MPADPADRGDPVGTADRERPTVRVRLLDPAVPLPAYAHRDDAGADVVTRLELRLAPGGRLTVPTGLALAVPPGWVALVHPRSGLAARRGLALVNAPGTVDAGYRGEVMVTLLNTDARSPVVLRRGERIAQLVLQRVGAAGFVAVEHLEDTPRGRGGHGSTGARELLVGPRGGRREIAW